MTDPHAELAAVAAFCDAPLSSREVAKELDRRDPLKHLHREFRRPPPLSNGTPSAYLCGANIGLPHRDVASELVKYVSKWGDHGAECLIRDPDPYFYHDEILHDELAHIVGAKRNEVVLMNGLTVNMHFLFAAFYKPQGKRTKVLCEKGPFPSDKHALVSQLESRGLDVKEHLVEIALPGQNDPHVIPTEAILAAIEAHKDTAAILWLPAMQFLTGQFFEVGPITAAARKHGILVGVDAAHAVGNVPLHFHDWGVDFAVWCSYKYLSSGPGGIGGAFVHERHLNRPDGGGLPAIRTCYKGWWGNDRATRFDVRDKFDYAPGAMALPTSNPSIASIIGLIPSVKLIGAAGMPALRAKSALLTTYLDQLVDRYFTGSSVDIVSPRDWRQRGAQLTLRVRPDGLRDEVAKQYEGNCVAGKVKAHVMKRNVYIDYRKPDIIRISPAATFSSFIEVHACVEALRETLRVRDAPEKRNATFSSKL